MTTETTNPQFERGKQDGLANKPAIYGCHFGMRSTLEADRAAYMAGWEAGQRQRREDHNSKK